MCPDVGTCTWVQRPRWPEEGIRSSGARVSGSSDLPDVDGRW